MGDFFKGWRRKAGVATLVMACVLAAGWIRSIDTQDRLATEITPKCIGMFWSGESCLSISLAWSNDSDIAWAKAVMLIHFSNFTYFTIMDSRESNLGSWPTGFGFFRKEGISGGDEQTLGLLAPYWSVVIPLSLLSAYLLLGKPGTPAPKTTVEPTAVEGT